MMTLITGQPGNGKTLLALSMIEKLRLESKRDVYYWNIAGLTLPWIPLGDPSTFGVKGVEPDKSAVLDWYKLPDGAIVVVDECQKLWRVRSQGSQVPKSVAEMETNRHSGFDLFLMSQNLKQIDTAVRFLVNRHINTIRRFGFESSTLYQWEHVADPNSERDKKEALKTAWTFPKEVYSWYKSAEVHTVKKDFPWRKVYVMVAAAVWVVGVIVYMIHHIHNIRDSKLVGVGVAPVVGSGGEVKAVDSWSSQARKPRIAGVAESAPIYSSVYKVVSAPVIQGCMELVYSSGRVDCTCTTFEGSPVDLLVSQCIQWIKRRPFDPTRPFVDVKAQNVAYLNSLHSQSNGLSTPKGVGSLSQSVQ